MILCIGTTPAVQRVMVFRQLTLDMVNRAVKTTDGAAGKSINVAKVLKALGGEPLAVGFLGGDRGDFIQGILDRLEIKTQFVRTQARTRECVTVIDESAGAHTELVEESAAVTEVEFRKLWNIVEALIPKSQGVVLSGTLAPGVSLEFYAHCTRLAKRSNVFTVIDAQGEPLKRALAEGPDLVKPNRMELAATLNRPLSDESSSLEAMRSVHELGARQVVVTAGSSPSLASDDGSVWRVVSPKQKAVNPIGSGDAFTAALVIGMVQGLDLGEACARGAAAGAANALTLMAGDVRPGEVERLRAAIRIERLSPPKVA